MGKFTIGDYICGIVVTLLDECESWFIITQYILLVEGLLFFISVLVVLAKIGLDRIGNNYQLCYEVLEEAGSLFNILRKDLFPRSNLLLVMERLKGIF